MISCLSYISSTFSSARPITLIGFTLEANGTEVKDVIISLVNFSTDDSNQQPSTEDIAVPTTEASTTEDNRIQTYYPQTIKNKYMITIKTTDGKEDKTKKDNTKKDKNKKSKKNKKSATTTESTKADEPVAATEADEPLEVAENNDTSQMRKMSYDVKVDTHGQLVMLSDDEDEQNGNVYISYSPDASGDALTDSNTVECSMNDLVNQSGLMNNQEIKYINVIPGVYTFNFENCQFENVDVYVLDDINMLFNDEPQDENNDEAEVYNIDVPSQDDITMVTIQEQASICRISVCPEFDFVPNFIFYSDDNVDGNFVFETGKQYYIEITSSSNVTLPEYIYYFQVME